MDQEQSRRRTAGRRGSTRTPGSRQIAPGKRTLTDGLAVQRRAADPSGPELARTAAATPPPALALPAQSDPRPTLQMLFGVQRAAAAPAEDPAHVHAAAARGTATPATRLPHADQIQRAFGRHDISGIQAHVGTAAAASASAMGARAYATGDHVVLGDQADLHTVAHEAAHVVQQRGTVQLKGGVGEVGDAYERHADEVADRVVRGESAEPLLGSVGDGGSTAAGVVQRVIVAHAQSNPGLKQVFDQLCQQVDSIGALTDQIGQAIRIRYGTDEETGGRQACFLVDDNTILINQSLAGNLPDIRHYILIELNHARMGQAPAAAPQPQDAAQRDQEELGLFTAAVDALRVEYHEWISAYLTHMETVDANLTMSHGQGPDTVTPRLAQGYSDPGQRCFDFPSYMEMQIQMGHTAAYDPAATDDQWVGHLLLQQAEQDHPALLKITEDEHLQNGLLLIQQPATFLTNLSGRANPFAGAMGTQLLDQLVMHQQV
ncbi:MAG TPA: DUF4157 domain-containing protein [Kofleriaceae bacterium]|jgi:hypothetical protein|nr:DUF4157 domain-containing protein [Kofleriaceae bacterium]